ncbi:DHA2 family efflux MFS transporter permease subunit [Phytomonospora endophytica]|uniref:EmrB/QacA subfamily drug resistance transporter n=1 Tax=Phytomonospora endophytica TaxID=714109 RepID=A0A841G180_9ACTN|nr:DHA2 family efflux MFS transporter permease subunit [Phytomonospora endophytica]MBB6039688.1 EmrB/QacA subfamily drug resistance transporter [Phytomonospora endophytica]GIG65593.1 MFS transporter [Phytomonospora endophytica]
MPQTTPDPRRWWALAVIAGAQLVLMLDAVIVNIALPSAQAELGLSDGDRQWVITAYTLTFGGLLLLGGRLGDLFGRKRTFVVGLLGFAAASALGGAATSPGMLLTGRVLQGAFASVLAPTIMSLIVLTFTDVRERGKAFGMYGIVGAAGGAFGLLIGGLITEFLDWRWTMYINVPVAIAAAVAGSRVLVAVPPGRRTRLDVPGTILGTVGLASLVFGFGRAESAGWDSPEILGLLGTAAVALIAFVLWQACARQPLVPLRILADRTRAGALLAITLMVAGNYGMFLMTTYFMQGIKEYSPLQTGLGYLPMTGTMVLVSTVVIGRVGDRFRPVALVITGFVLAITAMVLFTRVDADGGFATELLVPMLLLGSGGGLIFGKIIGLSQTRVRPEDTGSASALTNVAQQIGGSIGAALMNTIAISATATYVAANGPGDPAAAATHGYTTAFTWSAAFLTAALLSVVLLIRTPAKEAAAPEPQPEVVATG